MKRGVSVNPFVQMCAAKKFPALDFVESLETFIPNNRLSVIQFIEVVDEENYVSLPSVRWEKSFRDDTGFPSGRTAWPNASRMQAE